MPTRTILVAGNGTSELSFQLDGPDVTEVEAVLAEIDAGASTDTVATLTVTSPAGNDVAALPQGQVVTGGGLGRATWALRLAEDAAHAPTTTTLYALGTFAGALNPPTLDLPITTTASVGIGSGAGRWIIATSGVYLLTLAATVRFLFGCPAFSTAALLFFNFTHPAALGGGLAMTPIAIPGGQELDFSGAFARLVPLLAGDHLGVQLTAGGGANPVGTFGGSVGILKVA